MKDNSSMDIFKDTCYLHCVWG